jgi:hypothetical protein
VGGTPGVGVGGEGTVLGERGVELREKGGGVGIGE